MKWTPILYSREMVAATLAGRKTKTRRLQGLEPVNQEPGRWTLTGYVNKNKVLHARFNNQIQCRCPYGQVGDRLWVRETFLPKASGTIYRADLTPLDAAGIGAMYGGWKPSIHMPRWESRITLEVTEIRVERIQNITDDEATAEGVEWIFPTTRFYTLWERLKPKTWDKNPWVWVIGFKPLETQHFGQNGAVHYI